jgi:hypothetical protein
VVGVPVENGYVPTPEPFADLAAMDVFGHPRPSEVEDPRLLLPGIGSGNLYAAVRRYCTSGEHWRVPEFDYPIPECVGVEIDGDRIQELRARNTDDLEVHHADFLLDPLTGMFDWVLANPPYTRYKNIPAEKRDAYSSEFNLATGQFPLYVPFVEQSLRLLKPDGWATFILPVQALTLPGREPLRKRFRRLNKGPIKLVPEPTFSQTVRTCIITVKKDPGKPHGLWIENILPYGPTPLLERLAVEDVAAAATDYMERLKWHKQRIDMEYRPPSVLNGDTDRTEAGGQADLRRWSG